MKEPKAHHTGSLSPEMALLGLLYSGPSHGYDLHRKVITDLGEVWHLSQSQAYAILKRLEAQGEISAEAMAQEKLPSRQVLSMTERGRERFLSWLEATSAGSTRAIRMEFVTRLYFLRMYFPHKIAQAFDAQRLEAQNQIQRLDNLHQELPVDRPFSRISLDLRLKQLRVVLEWLDECQQEFGPSASNYFQEESA